MATESPDIIACSLCLKEIPKSVARSLEGSDYVYYFCGQDCYEKWQASPNGDDTKIHMTIDGIDSTSPTPKS